MGEAASVEKCGRVYEFPPHSRPRRVKCTQESGHAGPHFATWGGSQAWRQMGWRDDGSVVGDASPGSAAPQAPERSEIPAPAPEGGGLPEDVREAIRRHVFKTVPGIYSGQEWRIIDATIAATISAAAGRGGGLDREAVAEYLYVRFGQLGDPREVWLREADKLLARFGRGAG